MRPTRFATLLLCVLLPLSALAQSTPPPLIQAPEEPGPEVSPEPETPQGELIPRETLPGTEASGSGRVPLQILGGTAASAATLLLVYGLYSLDSQDCDGFFCTPPIFFFGLGFGALGLAVGPPVAIWLIGERFDHRGRLWPTLAGGVLGTLVSLASLIVLTDRVLSVEASVVMAGVWPVVTTMIIHELTRAPAWSPPSASGPRVLPMVSLSRHGSIVGGLVGSF
ncbi:MAG TPA: hypothetical protein VF815_34190 [Myxococcaceae bacterium]|jgi:hypothetical protein